VRVHSCVLRRLPPPCLSRHRYTFLVEVTMLLMVVMTYPFLAAFLVLRITKPEQPRAFRVPGCVCTSAVTA
jgi:hypothetical protein